MGIGLQCFTAFASAFGSFVMGSLNSWPSYTLELFTTPNTTVLSIPMTSFESSLLGSLPSLGAMIGTAVVISLIDRIGRQKGGVIISLPYIISWLIICYTRNPTVILVARFLGGISGGAFLVFSPVFISEVSQDSIRGALASGPVVCFASGTLMSYVFGWVLSYRMIIWTNLALSVFCAMLCFVVIESPLYLLRQDREEEARQALSKYKGLSPASKLVLEELSRLKGQISPAVELVDVKDEKEKKQEDAEKEKLKPDEDKNQDNEVEPKMSSLKLLIVSPASRRAFIVVATALGMQVFMGMVPVMVYAKKLFAQAAPQLSSHFCSVLLALTLTSGCLVTTVIADRAGRRILIILSCTLVGVCMTVLGVLLQTSIAPAFVSAIFILIYCFVFNIGAGTVPYVLLAESFAAEVQSLASMLLIQLVWFLNFAIIAVFPVLSSLLGIHGVFYIFAGVSFVNAVVSYFKVVETKGLSSEEIQDRYARRK